MQPPPSLNITVLVDEAHKSSMAAVASQLKARGFVIKDCLDAVGVITGNVPESELKALADVPGVLAVEQERTDYHPQ